MLKACIKYFLFYLLAFLTSWSFSGFAWGLSSGEIKEGQHYKRLDSKILSDRKIQLWQAEHPNEVWFLEFFYYGCMACQRLDGVLENYLSQKKVRNARVFFEQVPVVFRPSLENLAKAFYFAKGSSKFSELNHQLFEALLHQKINLTEIQNLKQFFMLHGFSEKEFEQKINSFMIQGQLYRAKSLEKLFPIDGTPTIVLIGKNQGFITDVAMSGSFENLQVVLNHLLEKLK